MPASDKRSPRKRVLISSTIVIAILLITLLEHRFLTGGYASFFISPSLLVALIAGVVTAFIVDYRRSRNSKSEVSGSSSRWRLALLAVVSAIVLAIDIYASISKHFTFDASVISLCALATYGLLWLIQTKKPAGASGEQEERISVDAVLLLICASSIFIGFLLLHIL